MMRSGGNIILNTLPEGADIWVNGTPIGKKTPAILEDMSVGSYDIKLLKSKYISKSIRAEIKSGVDYIDKKIELEPNYGHLRVDSTPRGAKISLNGKPTSFKTPHTFEELQSGFVIVELQNDGYGVWKDRVEIPVSETPVSIKPELQAKLGTLSITSLGPDKKPCRGDVFLDGKKIGTTPLKKEVLAVSHNIRVECNGMAGQDTISVLHNTKHDVKISVKGFTEADVVKAKLHRNVGLTLDTVLLGYGSYLIYNGQFAANDANKAYNIANTTTDLDIYTSKLDEGTLLQTQATRQFWIGTSMVTVGALHSTLRSPQNIQQVSYVKSVAGNTSVTKSRPLPYYYLKMKNRYRASLYPFNCPLSKNSDACDFQVGLMMGNGVLVYHSLPRIWRGDSTDSFVVVGYGNNRDEVGFNYRSPIFEGKRFQAMYNIEILSGDIFGWDSFLDSAYWDLFFQIGGKISEESSQKFDILSGIGFRYHGQYGLVVMANGRFNFSQHGIPSGDLLLGYEYRY